VGIQKKDKRGYSRGLEIRDKIIEQNVLGGEEFIEWIKDKFLKGEKDRECPPLSPKVQGKRGDYGNNHKRDWKEF